MRKWRSRQCLKKTVHRKKIIPSKDVARVTDKMVIHPTRGKKECVPDSMESRLTAEQQEIVKCDNKHHVRVMSCAGSGKTHCMTLRCLYAIKSLHVDPSEIMVVTFTRKAAQEIQHRLQVLLSDSLAIQQIWCGTFHSLCKSFLRLYAPDLLLDVLHVDEYPYLWVQYLQQQQKCRTPSIGRTVPTLRLVIVDEFQDVNRVQFQLIQLAAQQGAKIMAVGDWFQTIYGFRGSSPAFLLDVASCLPGGKDTCRQFYLSINFRSTPQLVSLANQVLTCIRQRFPTLVSASQNHKPASSSSSSVALVSSSALTSIVDARPRLLCCPLRLPLYERIVIEVAALLSTKEAIASDIGILARNSHALFLLESMLLNRHIPCTVWAGDADMSQRSNQTTSVILATIHASKGLEFDRVYVIETGDQIDDIEEWRCFYVAITRAKRHLTLGVNAFVNEICKPLEEWFQCISFGALLPPQPIIAPLLAVTATTLPSLKEDLQQPLGVVRLIRRLDGQDYLCLKQRGLLPEGLHLVVDVEPQEIIPGAWPEWVVQYSMQRDYGIFLDYLVRRMLAQCAGQKQLQDRCAQTCLVLQPRRLTRLSWEWVTALRVAHVRFMAVQQWDWKHILADILCVSICQSLAHGQSLALASFPPKSLLQFVSSGSTFEHLFARVQTMWRPGLPMHMGYPVEWKPPSMDQGIVGIRGEIDLLLGHEIVDFKATLSEHQAQHVLQLLVYAALLRHHGHTIDRVCIWHLLTNQQVHLSLTLWKQDANLLSFLLERYFQKQNGG